MNRLCWTCFLLITALSTELFAENETVTILQKFPEELRAKWQSSYDEMLTLQNALYDEMKNNLSDIVLINKKLNELVKKGACKVSPKDRLKDQYPELRQQVWDLENKYKRYHEVFHAFGCSMLEEKLINGKIQLIEKKKFALPTLESEIAALIEKARLLERNNLNWLEPKCSSSKEAIDKCTFDKFGSEHSHCGISNLNLFPDGLYLISVENDARLSKQKITTFSELSNADLAIFSTEENSLEHKLREVEFYNCYANQYYGNLTKGLRIKSNSDFIWGKDIFLFDKFSSSPEELSDNCLSLDFVEIDKNIEKLKSEVPSYFKPHGRLSHELQNYQKRKDSCRKAVQVSCKNVSDYKGKYYISYKTVECKQRDVTASDIDDDIRIFKMQGMTEAETFNHEYLKDRLSVCEKLDKAGFHWFYEPPPKKGCRKSK